jgi:hypothetical protein
MRDGHEQNAFSEGIVHDVFPAGPRLPVSIRRSTAGRAPRTHMHFEL